MKQNGQQPGREPDSDSLVSVIVCNYNHGRYLERAIESVAEQTHLPIELRLVDDASTDGSVDVIRRLGRRFRARFAAFESRQRQRNAGKLACLNDSLRHVRGDLVLVFDADDVLSPTFLEQSIDSLRESRRHDRSVAFLYTDCELIDSADRLIGIGRSLPWDRELLERSSYIPGCAVTMPEALIPAAPFDESIRVGTKHHTWLRLKAAGWRGEHLPRPLFSYRLHSQNTSGIGARLLPELSRQRTSEPLLGQVWPTAPSAAEASR
jgi:glycosyltransferase involved in cell wall biosynthesis